MSTNPFIPTETAPPPPELEVPDDLMGDRVAWAGPESPAGDASVSTESRPWPQQEVTALTDVMVMGLHGGAGASTVARLLEDRATDVGTSWPTAGGWTRPRPVLNVLAVCRTDHFGLTAGMEFARQWARGSLTDSRLLGILIIDDGPKLFDSQKRAARKLGQMTPHGWHLPWINEWRIDFPDAGRLPRRIRKTLNTIVSLTEPKEK